MNDFAKDELEDFVSWGEVYTEFGNSSDDKVHKPLINKIQSMIENYCAHDSNGGECEIFLDTCSKCNAFMLRETHIEASTEPA